MAKGTVRLSSGRDVEIDDGALAERSASLGAPARPTRLAFAAAHVAFEASYAGVAHSPDAPGSHAEIAEHIDWDTTFALRRRLAERGFGIAEAMDTAQRFEVGYEVAERLIRGTGGLGLATGFVAGAGTDHLAAVRSQRDLVDGVSAQAAMIRAAGGLPIVLPMEWLARERASPDDYVAVYRGIVRESEGPLLVHWLGEMFHPGLGGYFPGDSFERVMELDPAVVRGCKLSLLDPALERRIRARLLARGQIVLTGDDLHFSALIGGDGPTERWTELAGRPLALGDFSHALLGVLDAIAAPAAVALAALAAGDRAAYDASMEPCEALGRHLFAPPTRYYKAGLAFLAWLDGAQPNAMLANHIETARDRAHYERAIELGAAARVFTDAAAAVERGRAFVSQK